ncbi:MAG: Hsp20 family protein [Nitrospiraceae bacterium]|nr:Hsp20 family protein [Nitrospiraceae bacterium]
MALVRYRNYGIPWGALAGWDRGLTPERWERAWIPAMDLVETADAYTIETELPGLAEEDVHLEFKENTLSISGERKTEHTSEGEGFQHIERRRGRFERSFRFPEGLDADAIKARFENGVLTVTVPKPEKVKPREIAVQWN